METRKWVNTLSNEEFIKWGIKFFRTDWDDASVVMSFKEIRESAIKILSQPHETTADEDAHNIGWKIRIIEDEIVLSNWNIVGCDAYYGLKKDGTERVTLLNVSAKPQIDIPIYQIRTIADKKRKEMGW